MHLKRMFPDFFQGDESEAGRLDIRARHQHGESCSVTMHVQQSPLFSFDTLLLQPNLWHGIMKLKSQCSNPLSRFFQWVFGCCNCHNEVLGWVRNRFFGTFSCKRSVSGTVFLKLMLPLSRFRILIFSGSLPFS